MTNRQDAVSSGPQEPVAMQRVLVTGGAGFIGSHTSRRLLADGVEVVGVDNLDPYYDPALKQDRVDTLTGSEGYRFVRMDLCDRDAFLDLVEEVRPDTIIHLAAQPGVRHSFKDPFSYASNNLVAYLNVLEATRRSEVGHLTYASSSSVYANNRVPFSVDDPADHPVSLYAATKRSNELMAHAYADTYGIAMTGLRFFTVYGPWGRPDMAYYIFTKAIHAGETINIFGDGEAVRDFTYVDDIVEGVVRIAARPPAGDPSWDPENPLIGRSNAPWRIYNIGHGGQATVNEMITMLEDALSKKAVRNYTDTVPGDVPRTHAETDDLNTHIGFTPSIPLSDGLGRFVEWYLARNG